MNVNNKALFLDLDGTLITTNSGRKFPLHSKDWKLIQETLTAIGYFYKKGFKIIIISNQGGIEEGFLVEKVFINKINLICETIEKRLKMRINSIAYYYCKKMISYNRKPNTGMAYDAALEFELSLKNSIMVGNFRTDKEFADNAGIGTYYDVNDLLLIDWNINAH